MAIYIPMTILSVFFMWMACHVKRKQKIICLSISLALPVLVAMFRYNNGADYLMYLRMMKVAEQSGGSVASFSSLKDIEFSDLWSYCVNYMRIYLCSNLAKFRKSNFVGVSSFCHGSIF